MQGGSVSGAVGGGAGAAYTYYFNQWWAISAGIEAGTYGASVSTSILNSGKHEGHTDGIRPPQMILNADYEQYSEKQNAVYGHIPIMAQLLIPGGDTYEYYLSAGVKVGMAMSSSFQMTFDKVKIWAWLPYSAQRIEDVPALGYATRENVAGMYDMSGKLPLGINLAGAAEAGIRWIFEDGAALYTGIYLDYGILNVQRSSDAALVMSTQQPQIFNYRSILEAQYQWQEAFPAPDKPPPVSSQRYVNRVHPTGIGIKVKLAFNASGIPVITRKVRCGCPKEYY
jgi:hypothetical protein